MPQYSRAAAAGMRLDPLACFVPPHLGGVAESDVVHVNQHFVLALHFDETGCRVARRLAWVHLASSGKFALITVHPRRGRQAMDATGILPAFAGIAVHAWAPYDTYARSA